ncbi:MAG TPA: glycine cleavage system aminomethyltransferase GcvT, partial [Geminicoccaceae bacterium]|nr:glycine cleavage system aminomethyltransferase GcvT [Geminicoccaceae bacterium]
LGAKLVDFAGWEMPVQYPAGILKEHNQCRGAAALFDVSHMGQALVRGPDAAGAFERLVPGNVRGLGEGRIRYTMFTNDRGGILDDLMVANAGDGTLYVVVNAGGRDDDLAHMRAHLEPAGCAVEELADRALIALQGPAAETVLARFAPAAEDLPFMGTAGMEVTGIPCRVSRSGYTGEDGFEISVAAADAVTLARRLLDEPEVAPAGLGARDSLRLEAGLCLYGHDIDATTTPVEAGLTWTIAKRRRDEGGFPGAEVIRRQLADGPPRKLVGLRPEGRAPAREHSEIRSRDGDRIGGVTSGGFGPTAGGPIAMGYVEAAHAAPGTPVQLVVRGKAHPAVVVELPFVPHRYKR